MNGMSIDNIDNTVEEDDEGFISEQELEDEWDESMHLECPNWPNCDIVGCGAW
jgi:hypothetical protein